MSVPPRLWETPWVMALWEKQGGRCALCGEAMPRTRFDCAHATIWKRRRPSLDHIRPKGAGGSDRRDNFQLAHADCNRRKGCGRAEPSS